MSMSRMTPESRSHEPSFPSHLLNYPRMQQLHHHYQQQEQQQHPSRSEYPPSLGHHTGLGNSSGLGGANLASSSLAAAHGGGVNSGYSHKPSAANSNGIISQHHPLAAAHNGGAMHPYPPPQSPDPRSQLFHNMHHAAAASSANPFGMPHHFQSVFNSLASLQQAAGMSPHSGHHLNPPSDPSAALLRYSDNPIPGHPYGDNYKS